jgi:hypothetical protein
LVKIEYTNFDVGFQLTVSSFIPKYLSLSRSSSNALRISSDNVSFLVSKWKIGYNEND